MTLYFLLDAILVVWILSGLAFAWLLWRAPLERQLNEFNETVSEDANPSRSET
jgi:hypothetical protein